MAIRVLIISSRSLIRAGLAAVLRDQPKIRLVGEADGPDGIASLNCDLALWDVRGIEPRTVPVRFLALVSEPRDAPAWIKQGAAGCVMETASVEELLSAIRQVARGETFLPPPILHELVSSTATAPFLSRTGLEPLTEREREVLGLLAQGLSNKDIAQELYLSVRTVEGHLANVYGKLHLKSRTEAAVWAAQNL